MGKDIAEVLRNALRQAILNIVWCMIIALVIYLMFQSGILPDRLLQRIDPSYWELFFVILFVNMIIKPEAKSE